MRRTPILTAMLWTATAGACGDENPAIIDATIADGPAFDAAVDAPTVNLTYPTTLALGAECGGATTSADFMIENAGSTAVTVTTLAATAGFTVVASLPMTLAAGQSVAVTVTPPAAVIGTDRGGTTVTGTLTVTTAEAGALATTVALTSTITGANLELVDGGGAAISTLTMGGTSVCPAPGFVGIRNSGNAPATIGVSVTSSSPFTFGSFASDIVMPGGTIDHQLSVFTFGPCEGTGTVEYSASGSVCTTTPAVLNVSYSIVGSSSCFCS